MSARKFVDLYSGVTFPVPIPEQLARNRRLKQFARITGLRRIHAAALRYPETFLDHSMLWVDREYLYMVCDQPQVPDSMGLPHIVIPHDLAPYCVLWDTKSGAEPRTQSWLFGPRGSEDNLRNIQQKLAKAVGSAPPWNTV